MGRRLVVKTSPVEVIGKDMKNGGDVLCDPEEVFEIFVDVDNDLSVCRDAYLALVAQSSLKNFLCLL